MFCSGRAGVFTEVVVTVVEQPRCNAFLHLTQEAGGGLSCTRTVTGTSTSFHYFFFQVYVFLPFVLSVFSASLSNIYVEFGFSRVVADADVRGCRCFGLRQGSTAR